ncbi:TetR/AcrR family transcriptional regulator [Promicromonospora thailandica]|uniref:Transcriptional regulator, TetR family n=1 Tax=Promicromonospora thailandica TaxID=765201 RepID=A0A9X2JUX8_9MICO|nr:TetR-like C-terminal domain-containing protein [Promicromonospora thailandica]MCP2264481.1 transcriptional regulator, TetR family [Promicromonospora thailandica]BFF20459.1 TetR/AcrR family transcriptional regulator [Promicromonospora thailandica]
MPRAGLSHDAVVRLAVEVVDEGGASGFADLTLAKVAAKAGVAAPSLYKHVGSLADLRRDVAVLAVRDLTAAGTAATVGRAGADALRALAEAWRRYAVEHPGRYAATQIGPDPDDPADAVAREVAAESVQVVVSMLRGFGLPDDRVIDAVRAVRSSVHGFVQLELGGGFRMREDVDRSFGVLLDMVVAGVAALAEPAAAGSPR